ncbi:MAG: hypothetical protein GX447_08985 [Elusimicrobia bacterium]|nr:hypothetical protein [Elusimicrobiota bacterium]
MKKIVSLAVLAVFSSSFVSAKSPSMEDLKAGTFSVNIKQEVALPVPSAPVKDEVGQDLVYKFQRLKDDLWRLNSDTTWLRNDIDRLEQDARRIAQGSSAAFFSSDLRNMSFNMSRYYNDIQRLSQDLKALLPLAKKDEKLNKIASDIEWDIRDLDNRFNFDVKNSSQNLEWTVRRIDPKIIGYDAQWTAGDISRYARDIAWKTNDMRWDAQKLNDITRP